jgi:hypothetical protein
VQHRRVVAEHLEAVSEAGVRRIVVLPRVPVEDADADAAADLADVERHAEGRTEDAGARRVTCPPDFGPLET